MIMGVPYDAEIEYLESTDTQYIDTGVYIDSSTTVEIDAQIRQLGTSNVALFSAGNTAPKCEMYVWGYVAQVYWGSLTDTSHQLNVGDDIIYRASGGTFTFNNRTTGDNFTSSYTFEGTTAYTATLFALHRAENEYVARSMYRLRRAKIGPLDLIPVRVGNVGYMYDRVTRKLFGNAGTGSFVLGPDVARPVMGLRRYKPTARNYVQDGLVAMWDGIENAGWGTHNASATTWKDLVGVLDLNIRGNTWESNALSINGHTDWITQTGYISLVSTALTVELIAKVNGTSPSYYGRLLSWRASYVTLGIYSFPNSQTSARFETYGYGATKDLSVSSLNQPHSFQYRYENGVGGSASIDYGSASGVSASIQSTMTIITTDRMSLGAQYSGDDWTTFTCYGLRIYSRALTAAEIAANYAIDKIRFNLP